MRLCRAEHRTRRAAGSRALTARPASIAEKKAYSHAVGKLSQPGFALQTPSLLRLSRADCCGASRHRSIRTANCSSVEAPALSLESLQSPQGAADTPDTSAEFRESLCVCVSPTWSAEESAGGASFSSLDKSASEAGASAPSRNSQRGQRIECLSVCLAGCLSLCLSASERRRNSRAAFSSASIPSGALNSTSMSVSIIDTAGAGRKSCVTQGPATRPLILSERPSPSREARAAVWQPLTATRRWCTCSRNVR